MAPVDALAGRTVSALVVLSMLRTGTSVPVGGVSPPTSSGGISSIGDGCLSEERPPSLIISGDKVEPRHAG